MITYRYVIPGTLLSSSIWVYIQTAIFHCMVFV